MGVTRKWDVGDIRYDAERHESWTPDGKPVPHVTGILSAVGVAADFEALGETSPRVAAAIVAAGARGSAAHADCHAYDDNDLDWATVDPRVRPYVEAWAEFREVSNLRPIIGGRERRVYHPDLHYTGILDGIFTAGCMDANVLVDIKTADPESAAAHLQTMAYAMAWEAEHPDQPIGKRIAVWLRPGRVVSYTVIDYTARPDHWLDRARWEACLTVYREQHGRRARIG
jgi:hypothetical protein